MKGFAPKVHNVDVATVELFKDCPALRVGKARDGYFIELDSAASFTRKSVDHLTAWMGSNNVEAALCQKGKERFDAITRSQFIDYLCAESDLDNPCATQALSRSFGQAVSNRVGTALASGQHSITLPGGAQVRLDEDGGFVLEDAAKALDISPEDLAALLQSDEFQQYKLYGEGWE